MKIQTKTTVSIEASLEELLVLKKIHGCLSTDDLRRMKCTENEMEIAFQLLLAISDSIPHRQ